MKLKLNYKITNDQGIDFNWKEQKIIFFSFIFSSTFQDPLPRGFFSRISCHVTSFPGFHLIPPITHPKKEASTQSFADTVFLFLRYPSPTLPHFPHHNVIPKTSLTTQHRSSYNHLQLLCFLTGCHFSSSFSFSFAFSSSMFYSLS